ncbi:MAG: sugar phosphate nucleotidyltransferase, partial [Clostridia bacterium]
MALIGMALAGGFGERIRPLTLKASTRSRARAEARFMGRPAIRIQLSGLRAAGVRDVVIVSKSRESRFAIRALVGHGTDWGLVIRYTPPRHDHLDRGTADAVIRAAEHFRLMDDLLVFPVDTLLSANLEEAWATHRQEEALLTLVTVPLRGRDVPPQAEVVCWNPDGGVEAVIPATPDSLQERFGPSWPLLTLAVATGYHFVNAGRLRRMALDPSLARQRQRRLDFGRDLVNWALARGEGVAVWQAPWAANLGESREFLMAARHVLDGRADLPGIPLGSDRQPPQRVFSPDGEARRPSSWHNVYLGYDTIVGRNCRIENS